MAIKFYWVLTLLLLMVGVGMSLDPREVIARWLGQPRGYWLRVLAAAFLFPPLLAMLLAGILPLDPGARGGILLMSIAPGAPLLTRMVAQKGSLFDSQLAAGYQIVVGLLVPFLTPGLLYALGRFYNRDVWVDPWTLAWQVAAMQFLPLIAGLLIKHRWPAFAARAEPWMSRTGNLLLIAYLLLILFSLRRVLLAVGPLTSVAAFAFALCCLAAGHLLGGPTIALTNTNRHVGLGMLIAGLNFQGRVQLLVPFFAAYALLAPLLMAGYAFWRRKKAAPPGGAAPC
jgi:bile acid:Na+ symporter, BASS family